MLKINSLLSFFGYVIPSLIGIPFVGFISRQYTQENFSIYLICLTTINIIPLVDFGSTTTITRLSANLGSGGNISREIKSYFELFVSGLFISIITQAAFFIIIFNLILYVWGNGKLQIFQNLILMVLANGVLQTAINIYFSILDGARNYKTSLFLKIFSGIIISFSPIIGFLYGNEVYYLISGAFFARSIVLIYILTRIFGSISYSTVSQHVVNIIYEGKWIFVSNIIGNVLGYSDRYITSTFSVFGSMAGYLSAMEFGSKLMLIPVSASKIILPYTASFGMSSRQYWSYFKYFLILFIMIVIFCSIYSQEIFKFWLGRSYGEEFGSYFVVILVGTMFNGMAQFPYIRIIGKGGSRYIGALHVLELIPYVFVLILASSKFGFIGAAVAWSLRCVVDFISLMFIDGYVGAKI